MEAWVMYELLPMEIVAIIHDEVLVLCRKEIAKQLSESVVANVVLYDTDNKSVSDYCCKCGEYRQTDIYNFVTQHYANDENKTPCKC